VWRSRVAARGSGARALVTPGPPACHSCLTIFRLLSFRPINRGRRENRGDLAASPYVFLDRHSFRSAAVWVGTFGVHTENAWVDHFGRQTKPPRERRGTPTGAHRADRALTAAGGRNGSAVSVPPWTSSHGLTGRRPPRDNAVGACSPYYLPLLFPTSFFLLFSVLPCSRSRNSPARSQPGPNRAAPRLPVVLPPSCSLVWSASSTRPLLPHAFTFLSRPRPSCCFLCLFSPLPLSLFLPRR